jgi:pimeloyl-ACP methyl ester carboxylesterase
VGRRILVLLCGAAVGLALASPALALRLAASFTKTDTTIAMDDGVQIAATLYEPTGTPPAAGWPAIMMFHGLGGKRQDMNLLAESSFANEGYAVFTFDTRGHGESGGLWSLVGPREIADYRALFAWLGGRPEIDESKIGAWGISLGGGEVWRSVVEGIPFAAVETVETWTDLASALLPQNLSKSGLVYGFLSLVPADRTAPELLALRDSALNSTNLGPLKEFAASRSTRSALSRVTTPAFVFQGRRDFAFGLDQGLETYRLLAGPKRLYIGDFGHPPSTFPGPDIAVVLSEGADWYARFLRGEPNGIDKRAPVELAPDPYAEAGTISYAAPPKTVTARLTFAGPRRTISAQGAIVRTLGKSRKLMETFGAGTVSVTVSGTFTKLVAVLTATAPGGKEITISAGGTATSLSGKARKVSIRLISDATTIPAGSRLRLTLGSSSTVAGGNPLYLVGLSSGTLTVGKVTLALPLLTRPISK